MITNMQRLMLCVVPKSNFNIKQFENTLGIKFSHCGGFYIFNKFKTMHDDLEYFGLNGMSIWVNGYAIPRNGGIGNVDRIIAQEYDKVGSDLYKSLPNLFVNGSYSIATYYGGFLKVFNDFMGTYPVYHMESESCIIISTSLKILRKLVPERIDQDALMEYLCLGQILSGSTLFSGIRMLPPASEIEIKNGKTSIIRYASYSESVEISHRQSDIEDEIFDVYQKAVKGLYSSKKKYCMSLSGGMDSRMIYLNWPDLKSLLTETAGEGTTDYLTARIIVDRIGNPSLHLLEHSFREKYSEGFMKYYQLADNPTLLRSQFNQYHLQWKIDRDYEVHISGVGGEYINGENLYLSRSPKEVMKEMLFNYKYYPLTKQSKSEMIYNALRLGSKKHNIKYLGMTSAPLDEMLMKIGVEFSDFIGETKFQEVFLERFRTYILANSGFRCFSGVFDRTSSFLILPNSDRNLLQSVAKFHPRSRELRKLGFAFLRRDPRIIDIPVDTTHLPVSLPYPIHKFMRPIRMVANKGFKRRIPLLQKGKAQAKSVFPYFMTEYGDLRKHINDMILSCSIFDRTKVLADIKLCNQITDYNIYSAANLENLLLLYRVAITLRPTSHKVSD